MCEGYLLVMRILHSIMEVHNAVVLVHVLVRVGTGTGGGITDWINSIGMSLNTSSNIFLLLDVLIN